VVDPPLDRTFCQLFRFRGGLIVEMRDFTSPEAAYRYAGIAETSGSVL
jgi:ketosteroid isomerase-like protein